MRYAGQFTGDNNDRPIIPAQNNMGWTATLVNKDAKNPDRTLMRAWMAASSLPASGATSAKHLSS